MSNPALLDFEDTKAQFRQLAQARRKAREDFEGFAIAKADAEHAYARAKAERMSAHRTEGKGVGEAEILAKGDCAHLARDRDVADTMAKVSQMRIAELEADRAGLNRLAQWTGQIDPVGVGQ